MDWGSRITYFGSTTLKDAEVSFGIKDIDRTGHLAVMGGPGTGRADLIARMCLQDIEREAGTVVLDTDGRFAQLILERLDPSAHDRLIFIDPSDGEYPFSWNPLDDFRALPGKEGRDCLSRALSSIYRIGLSPLSDLLAERLILNSASSLVVVYDLVTDAEARKKEFGDDAEALATFERLLAERPDDTELISEHGRYIAKDTLARNLLGQVTSKFSLAAVAAGSILIADLSRIKMFPTRIAPLARTIMHAARARARAGGTPLALYLHDTLRNLSEEDIEVLFSDRMLAITVSDTAMSESDQVLREKALSRCLSIVSLAPSPPDLSFAERLFYPYIEGDELTKLEKGEFALALAIDGVRSRPFFAKSLPLPERREGSYQDLIAVSRDRYTTPRAKVDQFFKKKDENDDQKPKGKGGDTSGSFSDTFRSIFAKKPGAPTAPAREEGGGKDPAAPQPGNAAPERVVRPKEPPTPARPAEIPEDELKRMLYVDPVGA